MQCFFARDIILLKNAKRRKCKASGNLHYLKNIALGNSENRKTEFKKVMKLSIGC